MVENRLESRWISLNCKPGEALYFRREFQVPQRIQSATIRICGLGYFELTLNGRKVGKHRLDPIVTHYDRRVRYVEFDVSELLLAGQVNCLGVVLGNGWYRSSTNETWGFQHAPWRGALRLWTELEVDARPILVSDSSWQVTSQGPITFNELRNGETYDARRAMPGWDCVGFAGEGWQSAGIISPPGGVMEQQTSPAIVEREHLQLSELRKTGDGEWLAVLPKNISGVMRMTVRGHAGAEVILRYLENLVEPDDPNHVTNDWYVRSGDFQCDRYICRGGGEERWQPVFAYHGFRYCRISANDDSLEILALEAVVLGTGFDEVGNFETDCQKLNQLKGCVRNSFVGNFVGIPTDCPHREKNGWTGDASLACESGLWFYDCASSYGQWLDSMADAQRPSGQLPAIVPTPGAWYDGYSGPGWDTAFFEIPWQIWRFRGDLSIAERHFDDMVRYMEYIRGVSEDYLVPLGLGDWCDLADYRGRVDNRFTSTAWIYYDLQILCQFGRLLGREVSEWASYAQALKLSFQRHFRHADGCYGGGTGTEQAMALVFGLCDESERGAVLSRLIEFLAGFEFTAQFGIMGAKLVPRALAEAGRPDLAWRLITQPSMPGWYYAMEHFEGTSLCERWNGINSRNHIMFGDVGAWCMEYLSGIRPEGQHGGFKELVIAPFVPAGLKRFDGHYQSVHGTIRSCWEVAGEIIRFTVSVPEGCHGRFVYGPIVQDLAAGSDFHWEVRR